MSRIPSWAQQEKVYRRHEIMLIHIGDKKLQIAESNTNTGLVARILPDGYWHLVTDENARLEEVKVVDKNTVEVTLHIKKIIDISEMLITIGDIKNYD